MSTLSSVKKRPMHVIVGFLDTQGASLPLLEQIRKMAQINDWVLAWCDGMSPLTQSFANDHPDLVILVAQDLRDQEQALIRYLRNRDTTRRVGIVVMTQLEKMEGKEKSQRVANCIEIGADEVIDHSISEVELQARIGSVLRQKMMFDELRRTNHYLKILSLTDELTGLANMRHFSIQIEREFERVRSGLQSIAIVMIDIDYFKNINDSSNHLIGSDLLAQFGAILSRFVEKHQGEFAARYGGDEFVMMLKIHSFHEVMQRVESLRMLVASHLFCSHGHEFRLTASFGVASVPMGYQGPSYGVIKAADLQLYHSKKKGRNTVYGKHLSEKVPPEQGTKMFKRPKILSRLMGFADR